jgi:clan AA aspartic protease
MTIKRNQEVGKVLTTLKIINRADQVLAEAEVISPEQIRSLTLQNVLVDTGATTLCLPSETIAQLGLKLLKEVDVATAMGIGKARIFQDAKISIFDREGTFECLELPGGRDPLLGVIPLESLGLDVDLHNQTLKPLPISSTETYLTILSIS